MSYYILVQSLAIVASIIFAFSFHAKSKNRILLWQLLSLFVWALHFIFLGAWTGATLITANAVITIIFIAKEKYYWGQQLFVIYIAIAVLALLTVITWAGFYSIFSFLGVTSIVLAKWQKKPNLLRWYSIPASIFWIIYDIFVGSYGGIISESAFIISILVSIFRNHEIVH